MFFLFCWPNQATSSEFYFFFLLKGYIYIHVMRVYACVEFATVFEEEDEDEDEEDEKEKKKKQVDDGLRCLINLENY